MKEGEERVRSDDDGQSPSCENIKSFEAFFEEWLRLSHECVFSHPHYLNSVSVL